MIPAGSTRYLTIGSTSALTPLPVELVHFTASIADDESSVNLDWQTATETNNDYFNIERSEDAIDWESIIEVNGAGNSTVPITYSTVDQNPYPGVSYYRLKQTDFDGKYAYSPVSIVDFSGPESSTINIYPNPTDAQITITATSTEIAAFRVFNMLGQDVTSAVNVLASNELEAVLDLSNLPRGIYNVLTSTSANQVHKHTIILE